MLLDGRAPLPGELVTFPTLARSFREIATHGKDGFYKGRIAEEIIRLVKSKGGVMELEDLAKHKTDFVEPIKYTYKNEVTVYEVSSVIPWDTFIAKETSALPTDKVHFSRRPQPRIRHTFTTRFLGITALIALGILEQLEAQGLVRPLDEMVHNSAEYLHTIIEALRLVGTFCPLFVFWLSWCHRSLAFAGMACPPERLLTSNPEQILCGTFLTQIIQSRPSENSLERYDLVRDSPPELLRWILLGVPGPACETF